MFVSRSVTQMPYCRALTNLQDDKKRTPIHVSAASGNMKTTMLLLEVGADMTLSSGGGANRGTGGWEQEIESQMFT